MLAYLPMVRRIALKFRRRIPESVELEDLFSAALIGLVEASQSYVASKKTPFGAFAKFRVRGAVVDFLRELDWAPRSLRRLAREAEEAELAAAVRHNRTPTHEEIAAEMGIDLPAYQALLRDLDSAGMESLTRDGAPGRDGDEYIQIPTPPEDDPLHQHLHRERASLLAKAIEGLREPHRTVVRLFHFEEVTFGDIGKRLDLCESRICQINSEAKSLLHRRLSVAFKGASQ
jgi:RNA polymerase sigma factor for flagellar operon FliA